MNADLINRTMTVFQRAVHNLDDLFSVYPEISIEFRVNVDKSNQSEYHRIYNYLQGEVWEI